MFVPGIGGIFTIVGRIVFVIVVPVGMAKPPCPGVTGGAQIPSVLVPGS